MVSAFQVGVSRAKKRSYSVDESALPGMEAGTESWPGAADDGGSSTAGGTGGWVDRTPPGPAPGPGWTRLAGGAPRPLGSGVSGRWGRQGQTRR